MIELLIFVETVETYRHYDTKFDFLANKPWSGSIKVRNDPTSTVESILN